MILKAFICALLLATTHAVLSQPDGKAREAKTTKTKIQFQCQPAPWIWDEDGQDYRLECVGQIPPGKSGVATFDWQGNMDAETRIRRTVLGVAALNGTIVEGENRVSVHTTFLRDDAPVPTCQSKRRLELTFNRIVPVRIELKKGVEDNDDGRVDDETPEREWIGKGHEYYSSDEDSYDAPYGKGPDGYEEYEDDAGYKAEAQGIQAKFDEWDGQEDDQDAELAGWADHSRECRHKVNGRSKAALQVHDRKMATPDGLRVVVKCKSATDQAPSTGICVVHLRLNVVFRGFRMLERLRELEIPAARLVADQDYTCRPMTFFDLLNVLDACFPPAGAGGVGRRLTQAETSELEPAQSGAPTIPAGALWDDTSYARATRAARYCSTIHGCQPGYQTPSGTPRTWETLASWGGPAFNPDCASCFKDGINYGPGLGGPPVGWETRPFRQPLPGRRPSYRDAAIVLTDTTIAPEGPSITVMFRATASAVQIEQWISNIGQCLVFADITSPVSATNAEAGRVCAGWRDPIDELNRGNQGMNALGIPLGTLNGPAGGLMDHVKDRIQALRPDPTSDDTPTRIFVVGHSRGGALAATFAGMLLAEQQAGRLGTYNGPFGRRGQVSLYTFGAPTVGDSAFARYLEERMYERFRIINRYDPVVTGPFQSMGYFHFRPSVWYRDSSSNPLARPQLNCVMTPQAELSANLQTCFLSCNDALVCPANSPVGPDTAVAGTRVPASQACTSATENIARNLALGAAGMFKDHASYMGVDVDNSSSRRTASTNACREDQSMLAYGCLKCRSPLTSPPAGGVCPVAAQALSASNA